eukprot:78231-Hanusia_phi.AAC.3
MLGIELPCLRRTDELVGYEIVDVGGSTERGRRVRRRAGQEEEGRGGVDEEKGIGGFLEGFGPPEGDSRNDRLKRGC